MELTSAQCERGSVIEWLENIDWIFARPCCGSMGCNATVRKGWGQCGCSKHAWYRSWGWRTCPSHPLVCVTRGDNIILSEGGVLFAVNKSRADGRGISY